MDKDPRRRLGCGPAGVAEVMAHPFFAGVDWASIEGKQVCSTWSLHKRPDLAPSQREELTYVAHVRVFVAIAPSPRTQLPSPFKPNVNILDSTRAVRSWSDKDKAKLATIVVTPADQVRGAVLGRARCCCCSAARSLPVITIVAHAFRVEFPSPSSRPPRRPSTRASRSCRKRRCTRRSSRTWC